MRAIARRAAVESAVLLKNDGTLPFSKSAKRIAIVGPFADDYGIIGMWASKGKKEEAVPVSAGVRALLPDAEIWQTSLACFSGGILGAIFSTFFVKKKRLKSFKLDK